MDKHTQWIEKSLLNCSWKYTIIDFIASIIPEYCIILSLSLFFRLFPLHDYLPDSAQILVVNKDQDNISSLKNSAAAWHKELLVTVYKRNKAVGGKAEFHYRFTCDCRIEGNDEVDKLSVYAVDGRKFDGVSAFSFKGCLQPQQAGNDGNRRALE